MAIKKLWRTLQIFQLQHGAVGWFLPNPSGGQCGSSLNQWVISWSGKCMHHSGNLAIFQEQKGPPFMRYDPGKPVMAGSTRGIPRNWGMTGAWEEWKGGGFVNFLGVPSWELQILGLISTAYHIEIYWKYRDIYIYIYRILRCVYVMSWHVFTDFTVSFYLMICVNMCRHEYIVLGLSIR